jgi:hypothetical protein
LIRIGIPIQIQYLGGLQADLLGGSGGADAPPGIQLGFVFSQPRASTRAQVGPMLHDMRDAQEHRCTGAQVRETLHRKYETFTLEVHMLLCANNAGCNGSTSERKQYTCST